MTEHTYAECGHRVDYASQAEHDRDCPAAEAITTPPAEPADYITIDPAAGAHLAAAVQAEVDQMPAGPAPLHPLIVQARQDADRSLATPGGYHLTYTDRALAAATVRALRAAGWSRDDRTRIDGGTDYVLVHGSGRQVQVGMRVDGRHQLVLDGLDVDQMAGAVAGAGLTGPTGPTPAEQMAARYRHAEETYAYARADGNERTAAWALRAMTRRQAAIGRLHLAALDTQAGAR